MPLIVEGMEAACLGDPTSHGTPLAPGPGAPTVLYNGRPIWRTLEDFHACPMVKGLIPDVGGMVMMGAMTVMAEGGLVARKGDMVVEIPGGPNPIIPGAAGGGGGSSDGSGADGSAVGSPSAYDSIIDGSGPQGFGPPDDMDAGDDLDDDAMSAYDDDSDDADADASDADASDADADGTGADASGADETGADDGGAPPPDANASPSGSAATDQSDPNAPTTLEGEVSNDAPDDSDEDDAEPPQSDTAHAQRMAQFSDSAYQTDGAPEGAVRLQNYTDPDSGFSATLYQDQDGTLVLAYRGTDGLSGWGTDLAQGAGFETDQYDEAAAVAQQVQSDYPDADVELTGHSLGGGLATVGSAATGYPATTFNAANVNPNTYLYTGTDPSNIPASSTNYQVGGEPLSTLQNNAPVIGAIAGGLLGATGGGATAGAGAAVGSLLGDGISQSPLNQVILDPVHADGTPLGTFEDYGGHGMGAVTGALQNKANTENTGGASGSW